MSAAPLCTAIAAASFLGLSMLSTVCVLILCTTMVEVQIVTVFHDRPQSN